jgi:flagellar motor component MotA
LFVIIGLLVGIGRVLGGYVLHGQLTVLWQVSEFIIIGDAGLGAPIAANPPALVKRVFTDSLGLLEAEPLYRKRSIPSCFRYCTTSSRRPARKVSSASKPISR